MSNRRQAQKKKNNIIQPVASAEKRGKPNRDCFGFTPNWLKSGKKLALIGY